MQFKNNFCLKLKNIFFVFDSKLIFYSHGCIHNVLLTLPDVLKINVENDNIVLMLSIVVHINVEIDNVEYTLLNFVNLNVDINKVA